MTSRTMARSSRLRAASSAEMSRRRDASRARVRRSSSSTESTSSADSPAARNATAAAAARSRSRSRSARRRPAPSTGCTLSAPSSSPPSVTATSTGTPGRPGAAAVQVAVRSPPDRSSSRAVTCEAPTAAPGGVGHCGQQRPGVRAVPQPAAEVGEGVVGHRRGPVRQAVGQVHHATAERLEGDRDDGRRQQRRPQPLAVGQQRTQRDDGQHVGRDHRRRRQERRPARG